MSKRTLLVLAALLLGVIAISAVIWQNGDDGATYKLETVEKGDISVAVTATGKVNPVTRVTVGTQVSGTISSINADFNQKVSKGQLLAQIDPTFLEAQMLEAEANAEKARAQADQTKKTLERASELFDRKLISQAEKDEASTNYELAVATLKQSMAAYNRAKISLEYTKILSPIDGIVVSRDIDVGQTVAASLQAPALFVIANDLSRIQVESTIDEVDIGKVKAGQDATFYVDAYPDERFTGKVIQVRIQPIVSQNLVSYEVIIDVTNKDNKLLPGMTANLSIIIDHKTDILKVPNMALRFQPVLSQQVYGNFVNRYGSKFDLKNGVMVWRTHEREGLQPVLVETGITDGGYTEVKSGDLTPGEMVITGVNLSPTSGSAAKRFGTGK